MEETKIFKAHASYVLGLHFTADSHTLISSGMDNQVKLWSAPDWILSGSFSGHQNSVNSFDLSRDETLLATGSSDQTVKLWAFQSGDLLHTLRDRKKVVSSVRISPDGKLVVCSSYGGRVALWTSEGDPVSSFKANSKNLTSVLFSPDLKVLATAGLGDDIQIWQMPEITHHVSLSGHKTAVTIHKFIRKGAVLVSSGYEGTIRFWDAENWKVMKTFNPQLLDMRAVAFSPDEDVLAVSGESQVKLFDTLDFSLQNILPVTTKVINAIAFSPDGKWVALGAADKKIRIWAR